MEVPPRLELGTYRLEGGRSIRLSYGTIEPCRRRSLCAGRHGSIMEDTAGVEPA